MREKELRLALVCYGGVSLAIYMHGVTGEVHKLVRASKAYNAVPEPSREQGRRFADWGEAGDYEYETEEIYFELFKLIGRRVELRVIVDVIAGASAGGINGILLARGLAHDLPVGPLRDLWLHEADVTRLLRAKASPSHGANGSSSPSSGRFRGSSCPNSRTTPRPRRSSRCSCARGGSGRPSTAGA